MRSEESVESMFFQTMHFAILGCANNIFIQMVEFFHFEDDFFSCSIRECPFSCFAFSRTWPDTSC